MVGETIHRAVNFICCLLISKYETFFFFPEHFHLILTKPWRYW